MGHMNSIKVDKFEKLLDEGYGAVAIACYFGVSTKTLVTWVKHNYNGKTFKQLYLERRQIDGTTKN